MDDRNKKIGQILIWVVLAVPLISLAGGLILSLKAVSIAENWRSAFLLRNHPLWSLVFLVSLAVAYWILFRYRWLTFVKPWGLFKSINYVFQATIVLTLVFYAGLIVTTLLFPRWLGYSFRSDWALLVVASSPLIAVLLLLLIERATSVKAKFAGIELEFQRTITTSQSQTVTLEDEMVSKGAEFEIGRVIEEIRAKQELTRILVVRIRRHRQTRIEFLPLRNYVFQLSKITPLKFIVFVDDDDRYLAFMTVEKFKMKYPKLGVESLLEDIDREIGLELWERIFGLPFPDVQQRLERLRWELITPMWDSTHERPGITERDLDRLGAVSVFLQRPTVTEAYKKMNEHRLPGIPVVDEKLKFLGVATKDRIVQEVITNFLEKTGN